PIGHEFVGTITQAGPDVQRFKPGDRVVGSFLIACGRCWFCERHEYSNCDQLWVLGYGMFTGDLDGAQAEDVRVPIADLDRPVVGSRRATGERGADVVSECVGLAPAVTTALNSVRAGGTVAVIGVHSDLSYDFPLGEVWRRGVTIVMGATCNVQEHWDKALALVKEGTVDPTILITHRLPLEDAVEGYKLFEAHEALKVILKP